MNYVLSCLEILLASLLKQSELMAMHSTAMVESDPVPFTCINLFLHWQLKIAISKAPLLNMWPDVRISLGNGSQ